VIDGGGREKDSRRLGIKSLLKEILLLKGEGGSQFPTNRVFLCLMRRSRREVRNLIRIRQGFLTRRKRPLTWRLEEIFSGSIQKMSPIGLTPSPPIFSCQGVAVFPVGTCRPSSSLCLSVFIKGELEPGDRKTATDHVGESYRDYCFQANMVPRGPTGYRQTKRLRDPVDHVGGR